MKFFQKKINSVNKSKLEQIKAEQELIKQNSEQNTQLKFFEKEIIDRLQQGQQHHDKKYQKLEQAIDLTLDEFQEKNKVKLVDKQKMQDTFGQLVARGQQQEVMLGKKAFSLFTLEKSMPKITTAKFAYNDHH